MANSEGAEPFPDIATDAPPSRSTNAPDASAAVGRSRASSNASTRAAARTRGASLLQSFVNSNPPLGMWQATAEVSAKIPTLPEIRNGSFASEGWSHEGQMETRGTNPHEIHRRRLARTSSASQRTRKSSILSMGTPGTITETREAYFPAQETVAEEAPVTTEKEGTDVARESSDSIKKTPQQIAEAEKLAPSTSTGEDAHPVDTVGPDETGTYPNGYRFPKKHTWTESIVIGSKAFWKFFLTPFGFVMTIYGLNVVAWGAMIFFVLLNAAPAMCHPSCNADSSARKKWIEYDSQILTALFCVTAWGLAPWRFRDFYFLVRWRVLGDQRYFRKLAGINRSWFRLPGSEGLADDIGPPPVYTKKNPQLPESPPPFSEEEIVALEANPAIPLPVTSMPDAPLTGVRAQPTRPIMLDVQIWMFNLNTHFQTVLCGFMWHFNRFTRPSWATGFFISIGCVVAIAGGVVVFIEGSKVKKVEGISVHEYDVFETIEEAEARKAAKEAKHHKHGHGHQANGIGNEGAPEVKLERTGTRKMKGEHWFTRH